MRIAFAMFSCLLPGILAADCTLQSASKTPQVVELYTSEGCSSCPPADLWMSELPKDGSIVALGFHVDYWNDLGWPDRFSDARFTDRQHQVAQRNHSRTVYTPEVVVNGAEWRGWASSLPKENRTAGIPFSVGITSAENQLTITPASGWPRDADVYAVVTENKLVSRVAAGENSGRKLNHDHVVRAYAQAGKSALTIKIPTDVKVENAKLYVIGSSPAQGKPLFVLAEKLAACLTPANTR
jgi:hypothetical protein